MATTPDNPAPAGKALATILVVDDSRINLKGVSRMLEGHFRVLTAESGPIALQIAAAEPRPDLLLLDYVVLAPRWRKMWAGTAHAQPGCAMRKGAASSGRAEGCVSWVSSF